MRRFQSTFDRLTEALDTEHPEVVLREDPAGVAPERALVFVTAGNIQDFARAAKYIGLEVFSESDLDAIDDFPDGFSPPEKQTTLSRTLYATMPTLTVFEKLVSLWKAYRAGESAPTGAAPWWSAFDRLLELRPWGPEDRLTDNAKSVIRDRLPLNGDDPVSVEIEIWPALNSKQRLAWRHQIERRIGALGGQILDSSSISERGFIYEAILFSLPTHAVQTMLDAPSDVNGLATLEGVQLILPQTLGQAPPGDGDGESATLDILRTFNTDAPIRCALLDGTSAAAHAALNGGVTIEDIHDLVRLSVVLHRDHATAMASLILRGDLQQNEMPLGDTRIVNVPILIDSERGAWTPENRLFVDLVHTTLKRLISGDEPLTPSVFVVNFSIGVADMRFAGRLSALARLLDWWANKEGLLFVISAGNIGDPLLLPGTGATRFESLPPDDQRQIVQNAKRLAAHSRTLLAPAEAVNGITVGAVSRDLNNDVPFAQAGIISLENDGDCKPQLSSALGLGKNRSIKPDLLQTGGHQEVRVFPRGGDSRIHPVEPSQRTGLIVASPRGEGRGTQKIRGTSPAAALTTRAILQAAEALTGDGGPFEGLELPRKTLSLLTRALALNAARWPDDARDLYEKEYALRGRGHHSKAKEEVCRYFGYGVLSPLLMQQSPENGVTLVGYGSVRKDESQVFRFPLPDSLSGDKTPRSMWTTIAWFSPVNTARAQYRLASLEAVCANGLDDPDEDSTWGLSLKSDGPEAQMINKGSVWSKRLVHSTQKVPAFSEGSDIPICVQCRDTSNGGLNQDENIDFAIAVSLEVEANIQYDIYDEVAQKLRLRLQRGI